MPDVFALNARPSLARLRVPEIEIATAHDDDDARAGSVARLAVASGRLALDRTVIDALDARIKRRPPVAPAETIQNLVGRARRRLEQERLGAARANNDVRRVAVTRLQAVLET